MPANPQLSAFSPQPSASLLSKFRSDRKHLPLHPLEKAVLWAVALHLCFLPWALGTMHAWSQLTSLGLATVGLILALIPRNYSSDLSGGPAMRLTMWPRLLHFPIFWIGLALLGYIALQASNPSWVWERSETQWWLRRVDDVPWLPTSVDTPFERFDTWRQFIIYASAWLTVCTVWTGFTRRRSLQILLMVLVANAILLALEGFIQPLVIPYKILGLVQWKLGMTPFSSFIYKNHAGGYFALLTFASVAITFWVYDKGNRAREKSTPAGVLALGTVFLGGTVLFTLSRGASLILGLTVLIFIGWFLWRKRLKPDATPTNPAVTVAVVTVLFSTLIFTVYHLDFSAIYDRFDRLSQGQAKDESTALRLRAYEAGTAMLSNHWLRGVGAGGFRYLFPEYIKKYPEAYSGGQLFWEHAHRDWFEIPIELGLGGCVLLAAAAVWCLRFFFRHRAIWHSFVGPTLLGCSQTLAHAWFDFPFQNPAILCTWLALIAIAARWMELEPNA